MKNLWTRLKRGLIVSCQAEEDDPFNSPAGVDNFARAAEMGGAAGIRSEGVEKTRRIRMRTGLPVIGLVKSRYPDGSVCISRNIRSLQALIRIGCDIIAVDGTPRIFHGRSGPETIAWLRGNYTGRIMADLALLSDAADCVSAGADCLSSTLSGYTPETAAGIKSGPDFRLIRELAERYDLPVIAEGRITRPDQARRAIEEGAWAVVVGTAITRPRLITGWYVDALRDI